MFLSQRIWRRSYDGPFRLSLLLRLLELLRLPLRSLELLRLRLSLHLLELLRLPRLLRLLELLRLPLLFVTLLPLSRRSPPLS